MRAVAKSRLTAVKSASKSLVRRAPNEIPERWRSHYRAVVDHLQNAGKYDHEADEPLVRLFVHALSEAERMRLEVEADGFTILRGNGAVGPHPLLGEIARTRATIGRLAAVLGIGPGSRYKMSTQIDAGATSKAPKDPWAA